MPTEGTNDSISLKPAKMWEDLNDSEKIERIREVVKRNNDYCCRQIAELSSKIDKLMSHGHSEKGLTIPMNHYSGLGMVSGCITPKNPVGVGKSYF